MITRHISIYIFTTYLFFGLLTSIGDTAAIKGLDEGSDVGYCKQIDFAGSNIVLTKSGLNCTLTESAAGGGSSEWTDTGTIVHPNEETADEVVIGGTTEAGADIFLGVDGDTRFNIQGNAVDFSIYGDTVNDTFFVDGSTDRVGIGISAPTVLFDVEGALEANTITEGTIAVHNNDEMDASSELAAIIDDETGTGSIVFATSPTLVTPVLGTITSGVGTALTALNGDNIQDDTIDDDSIDFVDVTLLDFGLAATHDTAGELDALYEATDATIYKEAEIAQIAIGVFNDGTDTNDDGTVIWGNIAEGELTDDSILEADLKAVDTAADEECLTFESTTGDFEWQACGAGGDTNSIYTKCWTAENTQPIKPITVPTSGTVDGVAPTGVDTGTNMEINYVPFDDTADEYRGIKFKVPSDVDAGTAVTIRVTGYAATAAAQDVALLFAWHEVADTEVWDGALTEELLTTTLTNVQDTLDTFTKSDQSSTSMGWVADDEILGFIGRDGDHATDDGLSGDFHMTQICIEIPRS